MTEEEIAEKMQDLAALRHWVSHLDDVIKELREAAWAVVSIADEIGPVDAKYERVFEAITDMSEVIPCEDCVSAPCRCSNGE